MERLVGALTLKTLTIDSKRARISRALFRAHAAPHPMGLSDNRQKLALTLLVAASLLTLLGFLLLFPEPPAPARSAPQPKPDIPKSARADRQAVAPLPAAPAEPNPRDGRRENSPAASTLAAKPEDKEQTLLLIENAMTTYSEEGLPVLEPYLSHADPEIRAAAAEAIIQLAVPAGAGVLRKAAKNSRNPEEQIKLLQGADFLELPRMPLDELKRLMEKKAVPSPPAP